MQAAEKKGPEESGQALIQACCMLAGLPHIISNVLSWKNVSHRYMLNLSG